MKAPIHLNPPPPPLYCALLCPPPLSASPSLPQLLFDFVDSKGASGLDPGSYALVTQYPRRVFLPPAASEGGASGGSANPPAVPQGQQPLTLAAAGLAGPREVLFLEQHGGSSGGQDAEAAPMSLQ